MNLLRSWIILIIFTAVTGSVQQAFGDIHLPRLLSDGAIFQRETNNILQGWASNGEQVNILLNGKKVGQSSVEHGRWRFELAAQPAGGPHTLEFIGNNQLKLQDIYFGDVWVASGQSNMETTISRVKYKYASEISKANYPQIREFRVPKKYHFGRAKRDFSDGQWTKASPESIEKLSAVAYFFAKNIQQKHKVPIGIINNSYGGSTAEGWMSEEALEDFPEHLKTALSYRNTSYLQSLINEDKRNADKWHSALNNNDLGLRETHTT